MSRDWHRENWGGILDWVQKGYREEITPNVTSNPADESSARQPNTKFGYSVRDSALHVFSHVENQIIYWCPVTPVGDIYKNSGGGEGGIKKWKERRKVMEKAKWAKGILQDNLRWDEGRWAFILLCKRDIQSQDRVTLGWEQGFW